MDFQNKIIDWYKVNKRDLPWRNINNPYYIWLSEVILQQTRVIQGTGYYLNFIEKFPNIKDLALAKEDEVLRIWQGLGYYSRARNLHFTAKEILNKYNGIFPSQYDQVLSLKGVGVYTAAAICSFAFGLPYAVVDGNVIRVLSRFFGIDIGFDTTEGKKRFQNLAQELLPQDTPAIYNQAIMEFGALQCVPKSPNCSACVLQEFCAAYNTGRVKNLPIRSRNKKVKERYLNFLMIHTKNGICIRKRNDGIWKGLYEFPFIEFERNIPDQEILLSSTWKELFSGTHPIVEEISSTFTHLLSHQKIYAKFWRIYMETDFNKGFLQVSKEDLFMYPVSRLMQRYINTIITNKN